MGCSTDMTKPLPCPICGKEPRYAVFYHRYNGGEIYQLGCCQKVGMARRRSKEAAKERWNMMVLEYALEERRKGE